MSGLRFSHAYSRIRPGSGTPYEPDTPWLSACVFLPDDTNTTLWTLWYFTSVSTESEWQERSFSSSPISSQLESLK